MEKLNVDAQGDVGNGLACLQQAMIPNLQLKCSGRHQFVSGTLSLNISHIESLATGILSGSPIEQEEIHHPFCDCSRAHRTGGVVDRNCLHSMDLLLLEASSDWGTDWDQDASFNPKWEETTVLEARW